MASKLHILDLSPGSPARVHTLKILCKVFPAKKNIEPLTCSKGIVLPIPLVSTGEILHPPRVHLAMSGDISGCYNLGQRGTTSIYWLET